MQNNVPDNVPNSSKGKVCQQAPACRPIVKGAFALDPYCASTRPC